MGLGRSIVINQKQYMQHYGLVSYNYKLPSAHHKRSTDGSKKNQNQPVLYTSDHGEYHPQQTA